MINLKKYYLIIFTFSFIILAGCPNGSDSYSPGTFYIDPPIMTVEPGSSFYLKIYLNSGEQKVANYDITLEFDKGLLSIDDTKGEDGVAFGQDGIPINSVNADIPGEITIRGFYLFGEGPGSNLHMMDVYFKADAKGTSDIIISITSLTDPDDKIIGLPNYIGATVTIQ